MNKAAQLESNKRRILRYVAGGSTPFTTEDEHLCVQMIADALLERCGPKLALTDAGRAFMNGKAST